MSRKCRNLQELEEHGEAMVTISKVKPRPKIKAKKTVTVTNVTPKPIDLSFFDEPPAGQT